MTKPDYKLKSYFHRLSHINKNLNPTSFVLLSILTYFKGKICISKWYSVHYTNLFPIWSSRICSRSQPGNQVFLFLFMD